MRIHGRLVSVLAISVAFISLPSRSHATTITFSESEFSAVGFNGQTNRTLLSSDGQYRVESFWLNTGGHFHIADCTIGDPCEKNHNQSGALNNGNQLQGIRIARVDAQAFTLTSMDIFSGQASIGQLTNFLNGAGTWGLYGAGNIVFGSAFANVTQIYIADPFAAGGTAGNNWWDNIILSSATVPDPGSSVLLFAFGLLGTAMARRRWPKV